MSAPGLYSVENGLLTFAVCRLLGISTEFILSQLSKLSIPGRFEVIELESRPNTLFVIDYAHNGASLTAVLGALREYEPRRIICLFGSVGGRTFGRRAELGIAAKKGADVIIVTSDNPDNEDPMDVINDINASLEGTDKPVYLIPDRKKAVEKAYEIAEDGDFVLLAGKGHENYQLVCGAREPFSERRILERVNALNIVFQ
jgi:UDP-N-acetylmuramoyl-L-alanyl-D-glutamate--2,6-diaminopimelate ligase